MTDRERIVRLIKTSVENGLRVAGVVITGYALSQAVEPPKVLAQEDFNPMIQQGSCPTDGQLTPDLKPQTPSMYQKRAAEGGDVVIQPLLDQDGRPEAQCKRVSTDTAAFRDPKLTEQLIGGIGKGTRVTTEKIVFGETGGVATSLWGWEVKVVDSSTGRIVMAYIADQAFWPIFPSSNQGQTPTSRADRNR